jgi:hypothetical protein
LHQQDNADPADSVTAVLDTQELARAIQRLERVLGCKWSNENALA